MDPEYGLPAAKARDTEAGLLLAYEKTGYDATTPGRLPDLLADWSVLRLKEEGADAIKFYYTMMWMRIQKSIIKNMYSLNA